MDDKLLFIVAAIIAIAIVVCIMKKVIKITIFALIIIFMVTLIKGINVHGTIGMANLIKKDANYSKQLYTYTIKMKESIDKSINAINKKSLSEFKEENKNLHNYSAAIMRLAHSETLNKIHDKYCEYLKGIVVSSDAVVRTGDFSNDILEKMNKANNKLDEYIDVLSKK